MFDLDEMKDRFYEDLRVTISVVPRTDKLTLSDFYDRAGKDHMSWEGVMVNTALSSVIATFSFC